MKYSSSIAATSAVANPQGACVERCHSMSTSLQSPCRGKTLEPIMTADSTLHKQ
jgi:hypothetical protein